jgi:hypothetical protein
MPREQLRIEIVRELKRIAAAKKRRRGGRVPLHYLGQSDLESLLETLRGMK